MPPASKKARTIDPARVRKALIAQVETLSAEAHQLAPEERGLPTVLPGWDVHHLLAHIADQIEALPRLFAEPPPPGERPEVDLARWAASTEGIAEYLDGRTRQRAEGAEDAVAEIDEAVRELEPVIEAAVRPDILLPHRFGSMRALDFTVTRLVELVVHTDDLSRALRRRVPMDRQALALVVRLFADTLATRYPGGTVEVRVPPFAVVQCLPGPRHTRGTPPNVVETDPLTWIRLATGRVTWADARDSHALSASGARADLGEQLPLLR
ncbi:sterol carrier family protein [Streptomyces sp. NPDC005438]|uniref:maleylpyruvate isomerase family mycothiol-dependent enzyme n=1 Tax=Streptomyces sp. NPDC005438 TaxID=3156880 RepID=UPI0033A13FD9